MPGNPGTSNNMAPGYVGDWWILDVDGQRVVVQQYCDGVTPRRIEPRTSVREHHLLADALMRDC